VQHLAALRATGCGIDIQRSAAAAMSIVRAVAPAWRSGCHDARTAFELPVACKPPSKGLP